jgi:hypothetical protein
MKKLSILLLCMGLLVGGCRQSPVSESELRAMPIGTKIKISRGEHYLRVPGGWIVTVNPGGIAPQAIFVAE